MWRVHFRHMAAKVSSPARRLAGSNRYAAVLLGLAKTDPVSLTAAVSAGLEYRALDRFSKETELSLAELGQVIHVTDRTLVRRKTAGRLQPEESDRLLRASRVFALAIDLFEGDREAAKRWMETPQRALAGATPFQFATTDVGAREVESLIGRLEHGVGV
jgi:putative toxin-antitoxin system antitoxin component (TIGR02293 family)